MPRATRRARRRWRPGDCVPLCLSAIVIGRALDCPSWITLRSAAPGARLGVPWKYSDLCENFSFQHFCCRFALCRSNFVPRQSRRPVGRRALTSTTASMPQPPRGRPSLSGSKPDLGRMTRRLGRSTQHVRRPVTPEMFGLRNATPPVQRMQSAKSLSTPRKPPNAPPVRLRIGTQLLR